MEKRPTDFGKMITMILSKTLMQKLKAKPFNVLLANDVAIECFLSVGHFFNPLEIF
jgi:hypothetical protein